MSDRGNQNLIRTFICVDIPESVKRRIAELQHELRRTEVRASWVKPANIHLTLKFLGDVPASKMPVVIEAANRAIGSHSPFQVTVAGTGCFPSPREPRVLWVGVEDSQRGVEVLRHALEDEFAAQGFAREAKKSKPHLTIARIRDPRHARHLAEELLKIGFAPETFTVHEVIVMRSDLTPQGSVYTPQAVLPLSAPPPA